MRTQKQFSYSFLFQFSFAYYKHYNLLKLNRITSYYTTSVIVLYINSKDKHKNHVNRIKTLANKKETELILHIAYYDDDNVCKYEVFHYRYIDGEDMDEVM